MSKIVIANWKMRPETLEEAEDLFRISDGAIVCPPFVYLEEFSKIKSGAILGAQDISLSDEPGQTGEISGEMLTRLRVKYVIIGHSDRRWKLGETDEIVNRKLKTALVHELMPIVCIGEKSRDTDFEIFLRNQVMSTFAGLPSEQIEKCLIVYEPVWAISTTPGAKPDTPESALESIKIIKDSLIGNWKLEIGNSPKALYGGSVDSKNVADFLKEDEISGVLVGQASLNKEEFKKILDIVSSL
ncbi:MAG: triose-phosphate isomerase [Patescibacteria group bacterium]